VPNAENDFWILLFFFSNRSSRTRHGVWPAAILAPATNPLVDAKDPMERTKKT
jgi:hypothetical protein